MKTSLKVPDKLKVGFDKRHDTYDGKLSYIIYWDEKGVLRKESSWEGWRDKKIDPIEVDNVPTSGLVLNKKAGGYSTGWNHRQTYVRVYDPRGFEFEISIPNLMFILENCVCNKGKGLEGEFVYAWSGTELVLLPVDSPDYKEIMEYNTMVKEDLFVKPKELKPGYAYVKTNGEEEIFLGKFPKYDSYTGKKRSAKHFFFGHKWTNDVGEEKTYIDAVSSINKRFTHAASEIADENYADLVEAMEHDVEYSPIDEDAYVYDPLSLEELTAYMEAKWEDRSTPYVYITQGEYKNIHVYIRKEAIYEHSWRAHNRGEIIGYKYEAKFWDYERRYSERDVTAFRGSLEDLYEALQPSLQRKVFLKNGNFLKKEGREYGDM